MVPKFRTVLDVLALIVTVLAFPVIAYQLWDVE
jgi:Sec-independent protein secretion pathway component TatC